MTDILGIGSSGLTAYRKLLETTGNNIANANTEGYVRRDVALASAGEAQMLPTAKNIASGSGVTVDLVRRASDAFLQLQVRNALAREAEAQFLSEGLVRLEKAVIAPKHNIGSTVEDFFAKMQDLTLSPSSTALRLTLIDSGQRVAERFRVTATNIREEIASTEASIQTTLDGVNTMTAQIASLNREVSRTGMGQQKLNDLLDQRDKLLKDISKLTTITIDEKSSGEVTVYLGDSASGPKLVDFDRSTDLGMAIDGERVNFIYDPYGVGSVTNQITGGALAGQRNFREEALKFLASINRLAVALSDSINIQHRQGIDLKGAAGKDLFSTDSVVAVAANLNRGTAKIDVNIETAAELTDSTYKIHFDKQQNDWIVRSEKTGATVRGTTALRLEGLIFSIEGLAAEGDVFVAKPLEDAALGLQFLTEDPAAIAAAMPLYVDPSSTNAGAGQVILQSWDGVVAPPTTPPLMTQLFSEILGDTLSFRRDGEAFTIPSAAKDAVISSLGNVSAVHFTPENFFWLPDTANQGSSTLFVQSRANNAGPDTTYSASFDEASGEWIVQSDQTGKSARGSTVVTLDGNEFIFRGSAVDGDRFRIDAFPTFSKRFSNDRKLEIVYTTPGSAAQTKTLLLSGNDTSLEGVAASINEAAAAQGLAKAFYASVLNGALSVNALAGYTLEDAKIVGREDVGGTLFSVDAKVERPVQAADLHVMTTEGRELFTPAMDRWRGLALEKFATPIETKVLSGALPRSVSIEIVGEPLRDSALKGDDGSVVAGGVYALDIAGMPPIRLAGSAIAGRDNNGVAEMLSTSLDSLAAQRSWAGSLIDFTTSLIEEARFRVTIDGQANDITFRRTRDSDGNLMATGQFDIDGSSNLKIGLVPDDVDPNKARIVFSIPKKLGTLAPTVEVSGTDAQFIGFSTPLKARLTASGMFPTSANPPVLPKNLRVKIGDGEPQNLLIWSIPGGALGGTNWKLIDGHLTIEANATSIAILPAAEKDRDDASSLGFYGTDLDLTLRADERGSQQLVLKSSVAQTVDFVDASASVSRVGSTVRIYDQLPEDLVVSVTTTTADSKRLIATRFPLDMQRSAPRLGDIDIKVIDDKNLEIKDAISGKTVATRPYITGEPVEYLGLVFSLQAPVFAGDTFRIKKDDSRTGDNRNILALTQLQNSEIFGEKRGSFQDVYAATAAKLGNSSQSAETDMTVAGKAASDLQSAYDSKTGVSLDKEASDLIRYQQAYQAAAQVVSVARTLFDSILKIF